MIDRTTNLTLQNRKKNPYDRDRKAWEDSGRRDVTEDQNYWQNLTGMILTSIRDW